MYLVALIAACVLVAWLIGGPINIAMRLWRTPQRYLHEYEISPWQQRQHWPSDLMAYAWEFGTSVLLVWIDLISAWYGIRRLLQESVK